MKSQPKRELALRQCQRDKGQRDKVDPLWCASKIELVFDTTLRVGQLYFDRGEYVAAQSRAGNDIGWDKVDPVLCASEIELVFEMALRVEQLYFDRGEYVAAQSRAGNDTAWDKVDAL